MPNVKLLCTASVWMSLAAAPTVLAQDTPPDLPQWNPPASEEAPQVMPELPKMPPLPEQTARAAQARRPQRRVVPPVGLSPETVARLPKQVQNVVDFYGGYTSARALSQLPQRPSSGVTRPAPPRQQPKPFEGTVSGAPPAISPYLNLFIENENTAELPNYHMFVRPALEQRAVNSRAREQLTRLQREVQTVSYGSTANPQRGGVPGTGHRTRFFNTAQYYTQPNVKR